MNILHVITTLDPDHGGPPAVVLRLGAAQATLGHRVAIAAYHNADANDRIARSLTPIPGVERLEFVNIPMGTPLERFIGRAARASIRPLLPNLDILHLHGVWDTILRVAASEARRHNIPYALAPHGMLDPWCLGATPFKRLKKHAALLLSYRSMLNNARFLHVLNRDERDLLLPLGLKPPGEVIPNGVFMEEFQTLPARSAFAQHRPALRNRRYILFLSRLHQKKGLDILAPAFARLASALPDVDLVVAGPDGGARAAFERQIASLGIAERVHLTGPLYAQEKLAALVGADAFVLPSRQEGFSMAITEALACRTPCVISRECHFPEVAESNSGFVVELRPDEIAAALQRVLNDDALRAAMGDRGRDLVQTRFTWQAIARSSLDAYARTSC